MTPYEVLGVPSTADIGQIKLAYRKLVSLVHPDKGGSGDDEAIKALNNAYAILSDPEVRMRYDQTGEGEAAKPEDLAAEQAIMQGIIQALEQPGNPLALTKEALRLGLHNVKQGLMDLPSQVSQLERKRKQVRAKGDKNLFVMMIEQRQENIKRQIEELQKIQKSMVRGLEILEDYESIEDVEVRMLGSFSIFGGFTRT